MNPSSTSWAMTRIGKSIRPAVVDLTQGVEPASSKKHTAKCKLDNVNERIATWRISEQSLQQRPPKATGNPVNEGPAVEKSNCFFSRKQCRQAHQYRHEKFRTTARHFEADARDELQSSRVHHSNRCILISQFTPEVNQALESQLENFKNQA